MIKPPREYWETEDPRDVSWLEFIVYQSCDILVWACKIGLAFSFVSLIYYSITPLMVETLATKVCQYIK